MALWFCAGCTAAYSVGAPCCPNCGSTDYYEEGTVPKITEHGGATNAVYTPEEEPSPGNSSETSSPKPQPSETPSAPKGRSRARTTANRSATDQTDSSTAPGTDGAQTELTSDESRP